MAMGAVLLTKLFLIVCMFLLYDKPQLCNRSSDYGDETQKPSF